MTLGRGRVDYYVRSSERERKGKAGRPFDAKWVLEKVFVRRAVAVFAHVSYASRFSNSLSPPPDTMRRLPFDSDASLPFATAPSGLCVHRVSNKAETAFPLFRIRRLTSTSIALRGAWCLSLRSTKLCTRVTILQNCKDLSTVGTLDKR